MKNVAFLLEVYDIFAPLGAKINEKRPLLNNLLFKEQKPCIVDLSDGK